MTIPLKDAPGGASLIASLTEAVKDLALLYAATPDMRAQASLKAYINRIEPELAAAVGPGNARVILDTFAATVMSEKHRHEAQGASRA